ncbi:rod shape-determining protein MreC [Silvibacterium sp.]|uniref:rod shape-determining protein MreC n=1 Tax=Silvibacterium sp. TaxID=1964179 RepID=UPI0039E62FA7
MESFFSRYKNALVLLLVLVVQLLALAVQAKRPASTGSGDSRAVSMLRYAVVTVITPPEKLLRNFGGWIEGIWGGYIDLIHVRRDNADLRNEIERLRLEQASVAEDARQAQRLQAMLGFKEHYIYKTVPAQVVGSSGTDQSRIVYIDKGSDDGIQPDMPVVTQDGIVGRIKEVFPSTSQLMLISDTTSGVGVILETTRIRGVLKGAAFGGVQVVNVSPDERIKQGEKILTSGGDQIFPRGLPVGTVEKMQPDPDRDPLQDVIVKPAAHLSELEEVLVITNMGDAASAQEAKDLAESEAEGAAAQKRASDILSERLPNRVDQNSPADTNPDSNVDETGNVVQPLHPPQAAHPDGFSPDQTPPASEMTPGARTVPVHDGSEELPPQKAKAAALAEGSSGSDGSHEVVVGAGGTAAAAHSATSGAVAGAAATHPPTHAASGATGTTSVSAHPVTATHPLSATHPAGVAGSTGATGTVVHRPAVSPAATAGTGAVTPLRPSSTTHVIVDGPETRTARPASQGSAGTTGATHPANGTANGQKPVVHRSPTLVPDDGSRPPSQQKPKPADTATPQGRGV